ncbi:MAG TPA: trehalose-6-phosphate synthase [Gemmatimonadaceae bacterium]
MLDISRHIGDCKFILVSNREPYEHVTGPLGIEVRQPPGGLVSALDPTMREIHGTWVAWGSGSADRETADQSGCVRVPPEAPAYTLRRVWLDEDDIEGYYHGFANRALWPLCHMLLQHLEFRSEHWERYRAVNLRFAHAVVDEAQRCAGRTMVWIQDYHFALVPEFLRAIEPNVFTHQFWHIPFPPPDVMNLLPVNANVALLKGLLGNDLMEFQTERHVTNFLQCVDAFVGEADVDHAGQRIRFRGRTVEVAAFPISIDVERFDQMARSEAAQALMTTLRERYARGGRQLGVCVDRVDYTKGIPERLRALAHLWESEPAMRGRATFLFVCTPSRSVLPAYAALEREVMELVMEVNQRFGRDDWTPIVLVNSNVDADLLAACYRAADLCLVSSLQDGMNLVAKEFVGCQVDERGVLVLSRFTGAAEEIDGAILINPFNLDGFASAIRVALDMPVEERRRRMRRMRTQLSRATIFDWVDGILTHAAELMAVEKPASTRLVDEGKDERSPEAFL